MAISLQTIQQGLYFLADHVVKNLPLTIVDNRGIKLETEQGIYIDLRVAEFYDSDEDEYDMMTRAEHAVWACLYQLPENYRPKEITTAVEIGDKGWMTITIYYDMYRA